MGFQPDCWLTNNERIPRPEAAPFRQDGRAADRQGPRVGL